MIYFLTFQFENENRMTWIDRHGTVHPLTTVGSNNCDARKPFLVTDTDDFTDMEKLPILGITYGPLAHEAEEMTITIGPLICDPAQDGQVKGIREQVEALEIQMNDMIAKIGIEHRDLTESDEEQKVEIEKLSKTLDEHAMSIEELTYQCPVEKSGYRLIEGICYFFETTHKNYEAAKENCENKLNGMGKMFEPKTLAINEKIHKIAVDDFQNNYYWVGVNDIQSEGTWVYTSDGTPITFSIPWKSGYGSRGARCNCIVFNNYNYIGKWGDYKCTKTFYSICELEI